MILMSRSNLSGSNAKSSDQSERTLKATRMELLIYEHGEQVGSVDLNAETYEYEGEKEGIERVLTKMATEGLMGRIPMGYTTQDGTEMRGSEKYKRAGAGLGRYLKGALEGHGADGEVQTGAIDFDPDYELVEIGEHTGSG